MTGFNNRVVNPGQVPFKGYWTVVEDCGLPGQLWQRITWSAQLPTGCETRAYARASDDRTALLRETFLTITNDTAMSALQGRFIEVRLAMIRGAANQQPALHDLTVHGTSSAFSGSRYLYDAWGDEGGEGTFFVDLEGAGPMTYQWSVMYPWQTGFTAVAGATNSTFTVTNVDSWVEWTMTKAWVTNGAGEAIEVGPAFLQMDPASFRIPATSYPNGQGPATRYPATINVFGQPTNLASVVVTLWGLSHTRTADLNLLVESPSGKRVILMSNVGGTNGISNAHVAFQHGWSAPSQSEGFPHGGPWPYVCGPSNYGQKTPQAPFGLSSGSFSSILDDLRGDDPNGIWRLYIYDDVQGGTGQISSSWSLDFAFQ
jgi:subtilisin-like proprotein convertase family protein